ncbi:MAG TPA: methylmalonyl Co-A mutase-associated GTPase MeaB, partial [Acidimicrobiia bacterium]|nr:methylmalonyl Co-A mutase-associated GTPase MeaB [Acidimicrobiia bacterium]
LGASSSADTGETPAWLPPIIPTVAVEGRGVEDLVDAVRAHRRHLEDTGGLAARREQRIRDELRGILLERCAKHVDAICSGIPFGTVVRRVADGELDPYNAAAELVGDQQ